MIQSRVSTVKVSCHGGRAESGGEWRIPGGAVCNGNGGEGLLAGGGDCSGYVATGALQGLVIEFQRTLNTT